jgi:hypothetical protein
LTCVLGPLLYILFTSDLPQAPNVTVGTFADDTAILTSHTNVKRVSSTLQEYLHILSRWLQKWKIKVNETKSSYLTFTLRNDPSPPIYLNEVEIPPSPRKNSKISWIIPRHQAQLESTYSQETETDGSPLQRTLLASKFL